MKMVEGWKAAWKWHSAQALAALALLPLVWAELPDEVKVLIPVEYTPWALAAVAMGGLIGRLRSQS